MSDTAQLLRLYAEGKGATTDEVSSVAEASKFLLDAASEIERLRARVAELECSRAATWSNTAYYQKRAGDNDTLRQRADEAREP